MKQIFTFLFTLLFSLSLLANDGNTMNIYSVNSNLNLKIEVDGQRVRLLGNSITINNLSDGNHNVRVYRGIRKYSHNQNYDPGYEIIYATSVYLNRSYQADVTINYAGKVFINTYLIDTDNEYYTSNSSNHTSNSGNDDIIGGGCSNSYGNTMSAGEFFQITEQIRKERFDANRMISVNTIISKNNFTTKQVKELMLLFTFENNRLEVAKSAYRRTVDKENYYKLNEVLTFSSSKEELARFIRESR